MLRIVMPAARLHRLRTCRRTGRTAGLACVVFLALPSLVGADLATNEELARRAEAAFHHGAANKSRILVARTHFADATDAYRELHVQGIRTPALYRNLGNAAMLADRWPEAIWAYHVGLKLDPNDRTLREQLAIMRGKVLLPPAGQGRPDADVWPIWLHRPTKRELFLMAGCLYAWTWLVAAFAWIQRKPRLVVLTTLLATAALAANAGLWHDTRQARADRDTPLVVMATNADFHRGNGASYPRHPVVPSLPRGLEARQTHRRGDWMHIRLTTGETGWVHVAQVLTIEP